MNLGFLMWFAVIGAVLAFAPLIAVARADMQMSNPLQLAQIFIAIISKAIDGFITSFSRTTTTTTATECQPFDYNRCTIYSTSSLSQSAQISPELRQDIHDLACVRENGMTRCSFNVIGEAYLTTTVGDSGAPCSSDGNWVLILKTADIRVGDMLTAWTDETHTRLWGHQVVGTAVKDGRLCYITKGLHNIELDAGCVDANLVFGRDLAVFKDLVVNGVK